MKINNLFIAGFFFIILLSIVGYYVYSQNQVTLSNKKSLMKIETSPCPTSLINENDDQKNQHIETVIVVNEDNDLNEESTLENTVASYFNVENSSNITICQQSEKHAQGEFGQKWWLAFNNKETGWHVVTTGTSYIECPKIEGYDFPSEMVPACWDSKNNQLINF